MESKKQLDVTIRKGWYFEGKKKKRCFCLVIDGDRFYCSSYHRACLTLIEIISRDEFIHRVGSIVSTFHRKPSVKEDDLPFFLIMKQTIHITVDVPDLLHPGQMKTLFKLARSCDNSAFILE